MRGQIGSIILGSVLGVVVAGPGSAADMMVKAPPPAVAPVYSWTGFYIGGNGGYGWSADPTASFTPNPPPPGGGLVFLVGAGAPVSFSTSGAVGGLQFGYNLQVNQQWLVGLETDFDLSDVQGIGASNNLTPVNLPFSSTADERVEWFGTFRGRLGFLPTSNLLAYGTGGLAYGRVKQDVTYISNQPAIVADQDGQCAAGPGAVCYAGTSGRTAVGWTVGGGLEYAFADHWTARAEYLYVDLGSNNFNESTFIPSLPGFGPSVIAVHYSDTTFQIVRAALNYKF